MQIQKDFENNLNNYGLYSGTATASSRLKRVRLSKTNKRLLSIVLVLSAIVLMVLTVGAVNIAFDNSVMTTTPLFSSAVPNFSSYNFAYSAFTPKFTISIENRGTEQLIVAVEAEKLRDVLDEHKIIIDDSCVLNHTLDTVVYSGMNVVIDSITYEEVSLEKTIPHGVKTIELQTIPKGTKNVVTKGNDGVATSVYRRKFVNGVFESEELIKESTTLSPVDEVVQLGVGGTFVGGDGKTYSYSYYLDVVATCYGQADGSTGTITATGTQAREGVIAVDPRVIPLGTKTYVTSSYRDLGVCYAEDTGGFIKGNRIDVYLNGTLQQLLEFGRRDMRVYILE